MRSSLNKFCLIFVLFIVFLQCGCLPSKTVTVGATASLLEEVARSCCAQSDLRMVREGMPAYLMLMDGMIEVCPENARLLVSTAQSYSSFASAFLHDQDAAYAEVLYGKAKEYALRALEQRGFKEPATRSFDDFTEGLQDLGKDDVPYLFWAAACWGNWISLNLDSMEALAELPRVIAMMQRVLELDETFYYGGPHLFMGIWHASRPTMFGGDLSRAQEHFLKALHLGQGNFLMGYVYYANYYARQRFDKALFVSTLQKVLDAPADVIPELTLLNTAAKEKARELLNRTDEYF